MLSIPSQAKVKVIGIYDQYAYVIYQDQVGWIELKYLCMKS